MNCPNCQSDDVEKRGTRESKGEPYVRLFCNACKRWSKWAFSYSNESSIVEVQPSSNGLVGGAKRILVSSALNNVPVDPKFWLAISRYASAIDAAIVIIPVMYRNPTMPGQAEKEEAWWPQEVIPYLCQSDISPFPGVRIMGNVKVAATTTNPLSGLDSLSRGDSCVIGHAQVQLRCVATPQQKLPKLLLTTGSVSQKSYSKSKAGILAAFHHSLGFAVIEQDNEDEAIFHLRSVVGDEQSEFYDLDKHVSSNSIKTGKHAEALILGDEHSLFTSQEVVSSTFRDENSIVKVLKPKYLVRHDLIDSYSISHHHRGQPDRQYMKYKTNVNKLEEELQLTKRYLESTTPKGSVSVIVPSNHHNHITQWLREIDWRMEPWNAKIYHEMWAAWIDAIDQKQPFHPFTWWLQQNCKADVIHLQPDYPFIVKGVYLGYHGDKGINGAKGSLSQFAKIGVKTVTGHWHSPGIEKGAYLVGTSTKLNLEYTSGPSSWLNTHCVVHANGKRQLINVIKGRWRRD